MSKIKQVSAVFSSYIPYNTFTVGINDITSIKLDHSGDFINIYFAGDVLAYRLPVNAYIICFYTEEL